MSKVKKKVLEIDYMETNKCCTAKLSPNFSFSWFSTTTVNYSITGSIKKIVFQSSCDLISYGKIGQCYLSIDGILNELILEQRR